jgi:hypothetical protein
MSGSFFVGLATPKPAIFVDFKILLISSLLLTTSTPPVTTTLGYFMLLSII